MVVGSPSEFANDNPSQFNTRLIWTSSCDSLLKGPNTAMSNLFSTCLIDSKRGENYHRKDVCGIKKAF